MGEGEDKRGPKCAGMLLIDFTGVRVDSKSREKGQCRTQMASYVVSAQMQNCAEYTEMQYWKVTIQSC